MMYKLTFDKEDPNYILLKEIFKIIGSRKSKQIMTKNEINNINELLIIIKTILVAIYFETNINYVVSELESNLKLRESLNIDYVVSSNKIYNRISQLDSDKLQNTVNIILNKFINNNHKECS